ncbi:MAG: hypothetical protein QG599_1219 [Pseudomonadota bacterium]|nr:hypothetical protein [Pseudomonadota bacterium]
MSKNKVSIRIAMAKFIINSRITTKLSSSMQFYWHVSFVCYFSNVLKSNTVWRPTMRSTMNFKSLKAWINVVF